MDRYLLDVSTLKLDPHRCVGCWMCATVCPQRVFRVESKRAVIADLDRCMECGACALNCAAGAITVRKGVGCAAGIIAGALGGRGEQCC